MRMPRTKCTYDWGLCAPWKGVLGLLLVSSGVGFNIIRSSLRSTGPSLLLGSPGRLALVGCSLFPEETLCQDGSVEGADRLGIVTQAP